MNRETITSVSSGTVDIAAFVRARLDEWERLALAAGDDDYRDWSYEPGTETVRTAAGDYVACGPWCDSHGVAPHNGQCMVGTSWRPATLWQRIKFRRAQ